MKKKLLASVIQKSGIRALVGRLGAWSGVLTLNYHRIGNGEGSLFDRGLWSADVNVFDAQMRFLKRNFDVVSPAELPGLVAKGRGRYVMVTFDDGYRDNYTAAFTVLRALGVPATFFIATGFLDHPKLSWWDEIAWMVRTSEADALDLRPWVEQTVPFDEPHREGAVRTALRAYYAAPAASSDEYLDTVGKASGRGRLDGRGDCDVWMTWDMVREMQSAGMTIGGHTVNHPVLARMTPERQREEITGCARRLKEELGSSMRAFSYPVGRRDSFNEATRACLVEVGVECAFSYYGGVGDFGSWDRLDVPRTPIEQYMTLDWFKALTAMPSVFG